MKASETGIPSESDELTSRKGDMGDENQNDPWGWTFSP
jgi:hypothetical protein